MSANRPATLSQHGRAGVDALGAIQKCAASLIRAAARDQYYDRPDAQALRSQVPDGADRDTVMAWVGRARAIAEACNLYRLERFFQAYVALGIYDFGIPAIEERRERFAASFAVEGSIADIEQPAGLVVPDYFDADWHLRPGGWDGYDLYGPHGLHVVLPIFKLGGFAAVPVGGDIARHRADVIAQLPKADYARIYEPGCGNGSTLSALHRAHPHAELIGSDLSIEQLRAAAARTRRERIPVRLRQCDAATDTGEPDGSVDAVVTFALHHELPFDANVALFREMKRILKPGGDIVIADPAPFVAVDPFHAAILNWDTAHRGEPYFSEACASDWARVLHDLGFEGARGFAVGPDAYPWVTVATKPLEITS